MRHLLFYTALVLIFSCKKEIKIDIPEKPAILVVNSELSTDSLISFSLSETQNITNNNSAPQVTDAIIEVMDKDSVIVDVLSSLGNGKYISSFMKAKTGKRYLFRITRNGSEYWTNELMPDSMKTELVDTSRIIFQGKSNFFQYKIKITDDAITKNFYSLRLKRIYNKIAGTDTVKTEEWVDIESIDFILTENPESKFSKKHLLFKDTYFQGLPQEFRFGTALENRSDQQTLGLILYLSSYSESGYQYYSSVNEHLLYQNDPFSQPTLIRGNVSNAFGAAVGNFTVLYPLQLK